MANILLPGKSVLVDGTEYFIHGLVHGNPWVKINPLFKKIIAQKLEDVNVLCEDGFVSWIPNSVSTGETEYFGFGKLSFLERIRFLSSFIYTYLFSPKENNDSEIVHKIRKMNSIDGLIEIRNDLFMNYSKEPWGINALMGSKDSGTIDNPQGNIPLRVRRYIYEAKISLKYARENNLNELHLVVGCAHELPLEYLLNNREILDRYSL